MHTERTDVESSERDASKTYGDLVLRLYERYCERHTHEWKTASELNALASSMAKYTS